MLTACIEDGECMDVCMDVWMYAWIYVSLIYSGVHISVRLRIPAEDGRDLLEKSYAFYANLIKCIVLWVCALNNST